MKVRVSFTDDDGFAESVTSNSIHIQSPQPLYGGFDSSTVPESHDGTAAFTFEIYFSEEPDLTSNNVRDHILTVTGGTVMGASQTTAGKNIRWRITLQPDGDDDVTVVLPPTTDCDDSGAVCTSYEKMLSNQASITVAGQPAGNSPATGSPSISGTPQVRETLTASTAGISDPDGMDSASFTYQWLADGSSIEGATGSSYTLTDEEEGKTIQVSVSFTDDGRNEETLTSATTGAVAPQGVPPPKPTGLTATLNSDGSITLNWTAPSDDSVTDYIVLRRRPQQGETSLTIHVSGTGSAATTYTDTGTALDTRYVYRVKARNAHGIGPWSNFARIDKE